MFPRRQLRVRESPRRVTARADSHFFLTIGVEFVATIASSQTSAAARASKDVITSTDCLRRRRLKFHMANTRSGGPTGRTLSKRVLGILFRVIIRRGQAPS